MKLKKIKRLEKCSEFFIGKTKTCWPGKKRGGSDKRQLMLGYKNVQVKKVNVFWIKEYIQQWGTVWLAET